MSLDAATPEEQADPVAEGRLFSVIIPTYNRAEVIAETLDSVKAQTHRPIEIIVVDDGSEDATKEVVAGWSKRNQEPDGFAVRYFFQENAGVAAARNRGTREATGRYVKFLDSDDRLYRHCLETLAKTFESERADMILSGYDIFDDTTGEITSQIHGYADDRQLEHVIVGDVWVVTIQAAFAASLVQKAGDWKEDMVMSEDTEYIQRALCLAEKAVGVHDILASLRRGRRDHRNLDFDQACRVYCNTSFLSGVLEREDLPDRLKRVQVRNVATLGCKLHFMRQKELGERCYQAASQAGVELNPPLRLKLYLCRIGYPGSLVFMVLYNLRKVCARRS